MLDPNWHLTTPRLYISHQIPSLDSHCDITLAMQRSASALEQNPHSALLIHDRESARTCIEASNLRLEKTGYGRFIVSLRSFASTSSGAKGEEEEKDEEEKEEEEKTQLPPQTHTPIGKITCQLHRYPNIPTPCPKIPDLGFHILPPYRGQGYAAEAATALMKYYTDIRGIVSFAAFTGEGNAGSKGLLRSLGFGDRGVRWVEGVWEGRGGWMSVWTVGVGGEREMEGLGLGLGRERGV